MSGEKGASFVMRLVDMVTGTLSKISDKATSVIGKMDSLGGSITNAGRTALFLTSITTALQGAGQAFDTAVQPGIRYESQLDDLQAITGITGKALDDIGDKARKTALQFGGNAGDQIESYKIILSKLGPEIAQNAIALDSMGKSVQLLSKTMNNDAVGATEALTTAVNQYNVDLSDPIKASESMSRMMDIMTASAKAGAAEVPDIAASLKVAGLSAKNAGLSFEEANAAIQVLAKGSITGAEAGTALRNTLALMSRGDFMPKSAAEAVTAMGVDIKKLTDTSIPFAERLKEISKIQGDSALVAKVFGMENKNAAMQLMQNIPLLERWTSEVAVSGTTVEMAGVAMNTHTERMKRIGAAFADVGINIFNSTKEFLPFIQTGMMVLIFSSQLAPAFALLTSGMGRLILGFRSGAIASFAFGRSLLTTGITALTTAGSFIFTAVAGLGGLILSLVSSTAAMIGLNIAMYANPVGLFIAGLVAIGAMVAVIISYWDELKFYLIEFGKFMLKLNIFYWLIELVEYIFPGVKDSIIKFFTDIWDWIVGWVEKIIGPINAIFDAFGKEPVKLDMKVGKEITYADKNKSVNEDLNKVNSSGKKETSIDGDNSKARIVNLRIDTIQVLVTIDKSIKEGLDNIEERVANAIVGSARDSEQILSNG